MKTGKQQIRAAIFDMDGLLINSEPLWQEAEISVFASVGVQLTPALCRQTAGVRLDGVVRHWYDKQPWQGESLESIEGRILESVAQLIAQRGKPMPGVTEAIQLLGEENLELAVASSSPMHLIRAALQQLGIIDAFSVLHSAEYEVEGKPNPAVYRSTMSRLGFDGAQCVAFEDSALGVQAASRAGARVIAVPDPADRSNPGFEDADLVLDSLTEFTLKHL